MTDKRIFRGPGGVRVICDRSKVVPDDPGADTPAIVELFGYTSTFWCALDGNPLELTAGKERALTEEQIQWLDSIEPEVDAFLYGENS